MLAKKENLIYSDDISWLYIFFYIILMKKAIRGTDQISGMVVIGNFLIVMSTKALLITRKKLCYQFKTYICLPGDLENVISDYEYETILGYLAHTTKNYLSNWIFETLG